MNKWFILITILSCISIIGFLFLKDRKESEKSPEKTTIIEQIEEGLELEKFLNTKEEPKKEIQNQYSLKRTAWIPSWDYYNGISSTLNNDANYYSVSPVYFEITEEGEILARRNPGTNDIPKDIKIIPTIACFDWERIGRVFATNESMQKHKNKILELIEEYNYDGIDLDYESIELKNKDIFLQFIKDLSEEMDKKDKILSVTLLSKWGDDVKYPSLVETRQVQDWEFIGKYADEVRIMTYDFTSPSDSKPGPIAPIIWMEEVVKYAITKIPKEKLWLGIHLYSYEWVLDASESRIKVNSYTFDFVSKQILTDETITDSFDEFSSEGLAQYQCSDSYECTLYYQNPRGVKAREDLAKKYQLQGVAFWRLGGEENLLTTY